MVDRRVSQKQLHVSVRKSSKIEVLKSDLGMKFSYFSIFCKSFQWRRLTKYTICFLDFEQNGGVECYRQTEKSKDREENGVLNMEILQR